jgi:AraC family transcriptional regulator
LDALSRRAGFSPFHFHRIFTRAIGESVKEYIRRLRLERAAYRLKISDVPLLTLALESGFKTHETFTRAFAKHFGINPGQYRANLSHWVQQPKEPTSRRRSQLALAPPRAPDPALELPTNSVTPRLESLRSVTVAFIRHHGVYDGILAPGSKLADYWQELFQWGAVTNLVNAGSLLIGIAQDDPTVTPPEKARFDICVQVPSFHSPSGSIGCQTIEGGLYGVARHYGTFETLAETYAALYRFYVASGAYQMRLAPPFEIYGYTRVRDDLEIHYTDVYIPLEPIVKSPRRRKRIPKGAAKSTERSNQNGRV